MNSRCIKMICTLLLFIVLTGCEKNLEYNNEVLATEPYAGNITIPPEFVSIAIEQTGGLDSWGKAKELKLNCVATFYDANESYYLTEQNYSIFPWSDSIIISGKELKNNYQWRLLDGQFDVLEGSDKINESIDRIEKGLLSRAILNLVTAPARFLDNSFVYTRGNSAIDIKGRMFYPIDRSVKDNKQTAVKTVLYQNKDSSLIDMILLSVEKDDVSYLICGYDYKEINDSDISIPYRIEIFNSDSNGISQNLLIEIDVISAKQI